MDFVTNAIGRRVPTEVNGVKKRRYREAYDPSYGDAWAGRPGRARMRHDLLQGQCFEPSKKVIKSMLHDYNHHEISTGEYDDMANNENAVNMLDVSVLTTLEMDVNFNVNSICAGGRIVGGIGGVQGVAAGSKMTIMFLPIATGKEGKSFPRIVKDVYTVSLPGEAIDVAVTEEHVAFNPKSRSPYMAALKKNAKAHGLSVVTIEELHALSVKKAAEMETTPPRSSRVTRRSRSSSGATERSSTRSSSRSRRNEFN